MRLTCYASGSTGNLYSLTDGTTSLLIEAGLPLKEMQRLTGHTLSTFDDCYISHRHNDHCAGYSDLLSRGVCVVFGGDLTQGFDIAGTVEVRAFEVKHTVPNHGFIFKSHRDGESCVFMTDLSYSPARFDFSPTIFAIECNYADDLIPSDCAREDSIFGAHMSLKTCIEALKANDLSRTREIWLLHLSSAHSDEARFVREVQEATGIPTFAAPAYSHKEAI